MNETFWETEIERMAAWLYREQHGWVQEFMWADASAEMKGIYLRRARIVAAMCHFPGDSILIDKLARLCPCDPNPETTEGPEEECLLHGDTEAAVTRILGLEARVRELETRVPQGFLDSLGDAVAAIESPGRDER